MRTRFTALCTTGLAVLILAACGGGGGNSSTPAAPPAPVPTGPMQNQTVNNFTGPSSKVTVSFTIPQRTPLLNTTARMALAKKFGLPSKNPHVRGMYNTSPSASIRAAALQQNRYISVVQAAARSRSPQFVSPATSFMEFVVTDSTNTTVFVDTIATCSAPTCSATFDAPIGTGFNVTLYLYDNCPFLIAAGTVSNVSVVQGANPPITLTLNGVVYQFNVQNDAPTLYTDPSSAGTYHLNAQAVDVDGNLINHAGGDTTSVLLDSSFNQITGVTWTNSSANPDVSPASIPLSLNPDLSIPQSTVTYSGTGNDSGIDYSIAEVSGSQVVPFLNTQGGLLGTNTNDTFVSVIAEELDWLNVNGYPLSGGDPQFLTNFTGNPSSYIFEFPNATNTNTYALRLNENNPNYTGNVTLTDSGCAGIVSSVSPGLNVPTAILTLASPPFVQIQMGSSAATNSCTITATDDASPAPRVATLLIATNQANITIQRAARKH